MDKPTGKLIAGDNRNRLAYLARFLERRGGVKGASKATIKGILASLPVVGKTIEEVVFNATDESIVLKMESTLDLLMREIGDTQDAVATALCLLRVTDQLMVLARIEDSERNRLLAETLDQLAAIEDLLKQLKYEQAKTHNDVAEIMHILKQSPVSNEKHEILARKAAAVVALNRQLRRVREIWPPRPFLSRSPETSALVHRTLSGLRDILQQAHTIAELLWTGSDLHVFREHLERKMELALRRYETTQAAFEQDSIVKMLESLKETSEDESIYSVVPIWIECLQAVADITQNEILEDLKTQSQPSNGVDPDVNPK